MNNNLSHTIKSILQSVAKCFYVTKFTIYFLYLGVYFESFNFLHKNVFL